MLLCVLYVIDIQQSLYKLRRLILLVEDSYLLQKTLVYILFHQFVQMLELRVPQSIIKQLIEFFQVYAHNYV